MRSSVIALTVLVLATGCGSDARDGQRSESSVIAPATPTRTATSSPTEAASPVGSPVTFDITAVPVVPAPHDLAAIQLPTEPEAIAALLDRLPSEIAGLPRQPDAVDPSILLVRYDGTREHGEPPLTLHALDVGTGDFYPADWTAAQVTAYELSTPEASPFTEEGGRDGTVFWVLSETIVRTDGAKGPTGPTSTMAPEERRYTLEWGTATSAWLFVASADTPENLSALVDAFVAVAQQR